MWVGIVEEGNGPGGSDDKGALGAQQLVGSFSGECDQGVALRQWAYPQCNRKGAAPTPWFRISNALQSNLILKL